MPPEKPPIEQAAPAVLTVQDLHARLTRRERMLLLDVPMPNEFEICHLAGAVPIPLPALAHRLGELDRDAAIVVDCHSGVRSAAARRFLLRSGFGRVSHLAGEIGAWARAVDPAMPRY